MEILLGVVGVVGLIGFFVLIYVVAEKVKKARSTCEGCKTVYNFDEDIEWQLVNEVTKHTQNGGTVKDTVEIKCHCPSCGKVKTLRKEYEVVKVYGTSKKEYPLSDLIRKDFI